MATPTWKVKPAYSEAQIRARFGAGARLVRRGDGSWTIAGAAAAPAAGAPAAGGAAAPALPPTAPPVSLGAQAGIDSLTDLISSQPGIFNPQRLALFAEGARGLTDSGYFDRATADVAATAPDGSVTYRVAVGPDGQRFRDAANDAAAAANSRGMLFSSANREEQARRRTDLENARQAILRQLSGRQDDLTRSQLDSTQQLRGDLSTRQGEYADWRAAQPVPPPAPPTPTPTPAAGGASGAPAGVRLPRVQPPRPSQIVNGGRPTGRVGRGKTNVRWF